MTTVQNTEQNSELWWSVILERVPEGQSSPCVCAHVCEHTPTYARTRGVLPAPWTVDDKIFPT